MKINRSKPARPEASGGFTLPEVMVAAVVLGVLTIATFGAFSSGLAVVQSARENLRATQILMQKMETIRLFRWTQTTNTALATTSFTELYDPTASGQSRAGTVYIGNFSIAPAPTNLPSAYRKDLQLATVTVYWTNYQGGGRAIVRSKQMQTYVARYGMQSYVY